MWGHALVYDYDSIKNGHHEDCFIIEGYRYRVSQGQLIDMKFPGNSFFYLAKVTWVRLMDNGKYRFGVKVL